MDRAGDHFLTHTGLAENQNADRCLGNRLNLGEGTLKRLAVSNDFTEIYGYIDFVAKIIPLLVMLYFVITGNRGFAVADSTRIQAA